MKIEQSISAEEMARLFHCYREMLASDFGLQSSAGCVSWEQILPEHRNLMVATARLVLRELAGRQEGQVPWEQEARSSGTNAAA